MKIQNDTDELILSKSQLRDIVKGIRNETTDNGLKTVCVSVELGLTIHSEDNIKNFYRLFLEKMNKIQMLNALAHGQQNNEQWASTLGKIFKEK